MISSGFRLIRAFARKLRDDSISAFAAQAAFFIILSVFPLLIFILTLLNYLPISGEDLIELSSSLFPGSVNSVITGMVNEQMEKASGTVISVTVIATLWSASRGTLALMRGLNAVYRHRETRNYFFLRSIATLYTLIFSLLLIVSLVLLVFGNQLYELIMLRFPFLSELALLLMSFRSMITMTVLTLFFLLIYMKVPNRKSHIIRELPGAILSASGWIGFSFLFSFYIDNIAHLSYTYGSLTTLAICMLWLYFCMYIMFIGAEVNMILSHPTVIKATDNFVSAVKNRNK